MNSDVYGVGRPTAGTPSEQTPVVLYTQTFTILGVGYIFFFRDGPGFRDAAPPPCPARRAGCDTHFGEVPLARLRAPKKDALHQLITNSLQPLVLADLGPPRLNRRPC